jgi:hypothetical protein
MLMMLGVRDLEHLRGGLLVALLLAEYRVYTVESHMFLEENSSSFYINKVPVLID